MAEVALVEEISVEILEAVTVAEVATSSVPMEEIVIVTQMIGRSDVRMTKHPGSGTTRIVMIERDEVATVEDDVEAGMGQSRMVATRM